MKVLIIGTDRKLFEENSSVLRRSLEYAQKMEELHIVVFAKKNLGFSTKHIGNLHIYPSQSKSRFGYIFKSYALAKKIITNSRLSPADSVISVQDPCETGLVGWLLKMKYGLSFYIQIHTDIFSPYFINDFFDSIRVLMARFLIPKADGLRVVSKRIAQSITGNFPNLKVTPAVLPIFVDISEIVSRSVKMNLKEQFPQFNFHLLMASRLSKEKNMEMALRAFEQVVKQFPLAGLIIAGDGPDKNHLETLAGELGIIKNTVFIGWQDDLISLYKTADLFLLTSVYEGYAMTLIEAGASSCPIISTSVGVAEEIITDGLNGFLCQIGDISSLSSKILILLSNKEKRQAFKEAIQESVKKHLGLSREEYICRYVALMEHLLK